MSTLIATDYVSRLEDRIEDKAKAWLQSVTGFETTDIRTKDEDGALRNQEDPKTPVIIITAQDGGRVRITPWRNISLQFEVHADSKNTLSVTFNQFCARLERRLRGVNLMSELNNSAGGFLLGLAVNQQGTKPSNNGLLRKYAYIIDMKAVALEHTN